MVFAEERWPFGQKNDQNQRNPAAGECLRIRPFANAGSAWGTNLLQSGLSDPTAVTTWNSASELSFSRRCKYPCNSPWARLQCTIARLTAEGSLCLIRMGIYQWKLTIDPTINGRR